MSSICGLFLAPTASTINVLASVTAMSNTMQHRGPAVHGTFVNGRVAFAYNLGPIVDFSEGNLPISKTGNVTTAILDGKIYNNSELRTELSAFNYKFHNYSDEEIILYGYEQWGTAVFQKLKGSFAIAIWDSIEQKLIICRDILGEKPLHYMWHNKTFFFSSELKALVSQFETRPTINNDALVSYFSYKYIPAPLTIYSDVFKLEAATFMEINCDGTTHKQIYYCQEDDWCKTNKITDYATAKSLVRKTITDAIRIRIDPNETMGAFLSGGIDSSIVTSVMAQLSSQPIQTFSIGFENKEFDETYKAEIISKKYETDHHFFRLTYSDVAQELDKILLNYDEPFADASAIATYYVSKMAGRSVKGVLTGDGADEIFGGYSSYEKTLQLARFMKIPYPIRSIAAKSAGCLARCITNNQLCGKLLRVQALASTPIQELWPSVRMTFSNSELMRLLGNFSHENYAKRLQISWYERLRNVDILDRIMFCDQGTSLPDAMIVKVDRAAMQASLETRAPFLDYDVVRLAAKLPADYKIIKGNKKAILKDAFSDLLPVEILSQKKQGFGVPVGNWLYQDLREQLLLLTQPELLEKQGIFNSDEVQEIVKRHLASNNYYINDSWRAWAIFVFQKWYYNTYMKINKNKINEA